MTNQGIQGPTAHGLHFTCAAMRRFEGRRGEVGCSPRCRRAHATAEIQKERNSGSVGMSVFAAAMPCASELNLRPCVFGYGRRATAADAAAMVRRGSVRCDCYAGGATAQRGMAERLRTAATTGRANARGHGGRACEHRQRATAARSTGAARQWTRRDVRRGDGGRLRTLQRKRMRERELAGR